MKRIDDHTVELTETERLFRELFDIQLDLGLGLSEAIAALTGPQIPTTLREKTPVLDSVLTPEFVEWLTGGRS